MAYNCAYCKREFEPKRSTKRYCSAKCRVYYNRGLSVTNNRLSVTDKPLSVTDSVTKELSVTKPVKRIIPDEPYKVVPCQF